MKFPAHAHRGLRAAWLASALVLLPTLGAHADVVTDWNARAEAIAVDKRLMPPPNARGMAILHVAMFEAVNAIEKRYASYLPPLPADRGTSKEAAAAVAAHAVLVALHPDREKALDADLQRSLEEIAEGRAKASGIALGRAAATAVVAHRANDGVAAAERYRPYTKAGVYVPTTVPVSSTIGSVTPWTMQSGAQFRPAPPPALSSATWSRDVEEIREYGARAQSKRTPEQTDIGRFWFVNGPQSWNPIARQLAVAKKLDIVDSARLFALIAMATNDSFIAVFEAKFHYNFWRPITAIRNADLSDNPATTTDPAWLPLGDTPMHPEYPCAHCISSMAAAAVMQAVFGDEIPEVSMTSATAPGVTRRWTRLQDYADEVAVGRIYGGYHYRFSNIVAQDMGRRIAEQAVKTRMQRVTGQTSVR